MKKCPDCGMVIANQAIRCPKCKYTFTEAENAGTDAAVTPQAAAVSAAAASKTEKAVGIMPMIEVTAANVDELYGQLKAAVIKRKVKDNADRHTHYDAHQAFQVNNQQQPQKENKQ